MITYNDFLSRWTQGDTNYLITVIEEFKMSDRFINAIEARKYFKGENTEINKRLQLFRNGDGAQEVDIFIANNKIANEFFKKIVMQENSYLLGNGVNIDEEIKKDFDRKFDTNFFKAGLDCLIDGVSWIYCYLDKDNKLNITNWSGTDFIPLYDEETGEIMAGIRYWQLDDQKPLFVQLFEADGVTTFKQVQNYLEVTKPKTNYIIKKEIVKGLSIEEEQQEGFGVLPIFPLYANNLKESSLTKALKQKLDLWDIVISDFGNNLEDSKDLYWVLTNYAGQDIGEFLAEYKKYKVIQTDSEGSAEPKTIDVPYQARETILNILKKEIFQSAMAMDTEELSNSNLTNVAIKSIMANLDLKTDDFEIQVLETLYDIVELWQNYSGNKQDFEIELERRTIINDTEVVNLIYTMREDIDQETALKKNPLISPKEVKEIMERTEQEKSMYELDDIEEETTPGDKQQDPFNQKPKDNKGFGK